MAGGKYHRNPIKRRKSSDSQAMTERMTRHPSGSLSQISSLATIVAALLPHLHTLDPHLRILLPRGKPLVSALPKLELSTGTLVKPGLTALAIVKPAVRRANSEIYHEVEFLVEGRCVAVGVCPRVVESSTVGVGKREITILPEWLIEVRVHNLKEARVDVREDVFLRPLTILLVSPCQNVKEW